MGHEASKSRYCLTPIFFSVCGVIIGPFLGWSVAWLFVVFQPDSGPQMMGGGIGEAISGFLGIAVGLVLGPAIAIVLAYRLPAKQLIPVKVAILGALCGVPVGYLVLVILARFGVYFSIARYPYVTLIVHVGVCAGLGVATAIAVYYLLLPRHRNKPSSSTTDYEDTP
jgi:hypothetical protein